MRRMNRLAVGLLCALLAATMILPAAAHGCHGRRGRGCHGGYAQSVQTTITVCPYDDCASAGRHLHDGVTYCGYGHAGGCCNGACLALCTVEDCALTGRHLHDGVSYCGYAHTGGFCDGSCRALCPLENCASTGRHYHGLTAYCGYDHSCGFCDGSCLQAA